MKFKIIGVEVIKRRTNGRKPCYADWKNYDDFVLLEHLKKTGCRVPYLRTSQPFPLCKSKETIKKSQLNMKRSTSNVTPPCKAMDVKTPPSKGCWMFLFCLLRLLKIYVLQPRCGKKTLKIMLFKHHQKYLLDIVKDTHQFSQNQLQKLN